MSLPRKCTAISSLLALTLLLAAGIAAAAQPVAIVTNLSGMLLVKKHDGSVRILAVRSAVEAGDTMLSQPGSYARLQFLDASNVTLAPGTSFAIDAFAFDAAHADADVAHFTLDKGGVRVQAGTLGKRSPAAATLTTPAATVTLGAASATVQLVERDATALASLRAWMFASSAGGPGSPLPAAPLQLAQLTLPPASPAMPPGLYVAVTDGLIQVSNKSGATNFAAGQFGYTASPMVPPVVVPKNPGIQFTLPPTFSTTAPTGGLPAKSNTVDCEVR